MSAERVLQIARGELGTTENPPGSNRQKYGAAYGMNGVAWCAEFVWWAFTQAGDSGLIPKTAYTPTFADWFRGRRQWGTAPRVGAVVFYDFPGDGVNRISHTGIVEAVNGDGSIVAIEGNTSSGTGGSQTNGGIVARRTRRTGIVGYGYPAYSGAPATTAPPVSPAAGGTLLRKGSKGAAVSALQARLNRDYPAYSRLVVDGDFGPATDAAVREFQRRSGLTADGIAGPATLGRLGL
jgi:hypothetical protein